MRHFAIPCLAFLVLCCPSSLFCQEPDLTRLPDGVSGGRTPPTGESSAEVWTGARTVALDHLPLLPGLLAVHQFSSHNKEGLNGDAGWRLYDDAQGHAVIFDVEGPGCIRSMWSTAIREGADFLFYFDGEREPRFEIPMLDFFQGKHPLFPAPLNSYERRGRWGEMPFAGNSFTPIPFAEGLKISVRGRLEFFHILFHRYPYGTGVTTFTGGEDREYLLEAFRDTGAAAGTAVGKEKGSGKGSDAAGQVLQAAAEKLDPGKDLVLADLERSGCIRRLVIEGEASAEFLREVMIRMRWDGHLLCDVQAPLGYFFGSAVNPRPMRSLAVCVEPLEGGRLRLTTRFPMPFFERAEVRLVNRSSRSFAGVRGEVSVGPQVFPRDRTGYFATCFRKGWTTYGRDWLLFESPGTGWFVGAVQSMRLEHYCEGDEHIYLDGAVSPQINGTGSEDYYLGCFWPNREFNSPFANCVGDIQEEGGGTFQGSYDVPSCYSRFHLEAPIPFLGRLDARIQHGGQSHITSSYGSLAFAYLRRRSALVLSDFIDVGLAASEEAHRYRAADSEIVGPLTARPEGQYMDGEIRDTGRSHGGGKITFIVAVDPANRGVRIRRRLDQASARQTAAVHIDGVRVGTWYDPNHNDHLRWFDSDFDVHPGFTAGKERLEVRLEVIAGGGRGPFTDFRYEVFSFLP